jgi:hypothetical protein
VYFVSKKYVCDIFCSVVELHPVPHTAPHPDPVPYPDLVPHPVPHTVLHPDPVPLLDPVQHPDPVRELDPDLDTADQWWAVSMTPLTKIDTADQGALKFTILWLLLKGIPIKKSYIGKLYYTTVYLQHSYKNMGVN